MVQSVNRAGHDGNDRAAVAILRKSLDFCVKVISVCNNKAGVQSRRLQKKLE